MNFLALDAKKMLALEPIVLTLEGSFLNRALHSCPNGGALIPPLKKKSFAW